MPRLIARPIASTLLTLAALAGPLAPGAGAQTVDEILRQSFTAQNGNGTLAEAEALLRARLSASPGDDQTLAALGVVRFLESGELILQRTYRYGGFNLPVQASMMTGMGGVGQNIGYNSEPEPCTYEDFRASFADWIDAVARAEATLAEVGEGEVKVRIPVGLARMDLNADGKGGDREQLWKFFIAVQRQFSPTQEDADAFEIAFDRGDVAWLRGYCHLCMAAGELVLAHDLRDLFERTGHIFYAKNQTPFEFLKGSRKMFDYSTGIDATDAIAFIHLLSFEVAEPERMERARLHLLETLRLAHEMWGYYDVETDDDREWIPNVRQEDGVVPNAPITPEMREVWLRALGEAEAMLEGRKLLRFWRGEGERGINAKRFFTEPRRFDLVLWVQGSAAAPYLEEGEFTSEGLWRDLEAAFDRGVFRYMWWMN